MSTTTRLTTVLAGILLVSVCGVLGAGVGAPDAAAGAPGCVVRFVSLRFVPASVIEGGTTQLRATIANCTGRTQGATSTVFGAEPPPCPILDPVAHHITVPRRGRVVEVSTFTALPCPGSANVTTRISNSQGVQLVERTAQFTVVAPPPA